MAPPPPPKPHAAPPSQLVAASLRQPSPSPSLSPSNALSKLPRPACQSPPSKSAASPTPPFRHETPSRGRTLTYLDLSRYFHLPINTAARELGVCVTALKKQCRKHGVPRWPHRKLKSLDKLKEKLEKEEATAADKEYYKHEIHSIVQKKDHIFRASPSLRDSASSPSTSERAKPPTPLATDPRIRPVTLSRPLLTQDHPPLHPHTPVLIANPTSLQARPPSIPSSHPQPPAHLPQGVPAMQMPPPSVAFCGAMGCDCYVNGGVSSQGYHLPFARPSMAPTSSSLVGPNGQPTVSAPMSSNPQAFYGPSPQYQYTPYPHQPPFHNMVQVNVLEQQPYPHQLVSAGGAVQQQALAGPQSAQGVASGGNGSPNLLKTGPMLPQSSPVNGQLGAVPPGAYEVYAGQGAGGQPQNGFVYSGFPPQGPLQMEGMLQASQSAGTSPQMVPHYWTEVPHAGSPGNLVTMYNQTTHYHHHHGAEFGQNGHSVAGGVVDGTASSATNNSDAGERRIPLHARAKEGSGAPTTTTITASQGTGQRRQMGSRGAVPSSSPKPDSRPFKTPMNGMVSKNASEVTARPKEAPHSKSSHPRKTNGRVEKPKDNSKPNPKIKINDRTTQQNGTSRNKGADGNHTRMQASMRNGTVQNGSVVNEVSNLKASDGKNSSDSTAQTPQVDISNRGLMAPPREPFKASAQPKPPSAARNPTPPVANRTVAYGKRPGMELKPGSGRSGNKRPRNSGGSQPWEPPYIGAGNTDVAAMLHRSREVSAQMREITPPSDREETPEDQDTGDASGSATGSGSGDGTGSGSGCGSGEGDSDGSKEEEERVLGGAKMEREGVDPPSPSMRGGAKRRKGGHGVKGWEMGGCLDEGIGNGGGGNVGGIASGSSVAVRARRYEQVVHQCVALQCAQWCVDKNLRVTNSMGSKGLLGLAGVAGHGRVMFDGAEGMVESSQGMRSRYLTVVKGQRMEWVADHGRKRYLVVLAPFRKRSGAEISGVSGLVVELSQRVEVAR